MPVQSSPGKRVFFVMETEDSKINFASVCFETVSGQSIATRFPE